MNEWSGQRKIMTLSEIAMSIRKTLSERYPEAFWIKAEMNKLHHYPQSGHCYPELVEKSGDRIVAEMKATIWRDDFQRINDRFLEVLHEPLKDGIKILFLARITFSPAYGLSLGILDIDPSWSLGELEREKQATLARLKTEGLFDRNRSLQLPLLTSRLAVISVETSKGYSDFCTIIDENPYGYKVFHMLFPALLQGDQAIPSIMGQLARIARVKEHFDAVIILRGGGGDVGLSCFNHYDLACAVALFPLPVLTGIGHSTNETVTEMVACRNAITPTELAGFILQKYHEFAGPIREAASFLAVESEAILRRRGADIKLTARQLRSNVRTGNRVRQSALAADEKTIRNRLSWFFRTKKETDLERQRTILRAGVTGQLQDRETLLTGLEKSVELLDPVRVLGRGYSITRSGGKIIRSVGEVMPGDRLETWTADGTIGSRVEATEKNGDDHE